MAVAGGSSQDPEALSVPFPPEKFALDLTWVDSSRRGFPTFLPLRIIMALKRLSRFLSLVQSATSVYFRRNIGVTAVAFNKELDPVQKLFVDKIREYKSKRQAVGGPVDIGPEYQQDLDRELFKLKQMYGKADMNTFPTFKFDDPKFEEAPKPQA